jgi:hypothetical protein
METALVTLNLLQQKNPLSDKIISTNLSGKIALVRKTVMGILN